MKCKGECVSGNVDRRNFLKFAIGGAAGLVVAPGMQIFAQDTKAQFKRAKSCILLWMSGGPSQIDTFDPKEGNKNGGPTKAIQTTARGMRIADNLPLLAKQGKHFSIIRSLYTMQTAHERARFLLHTGYEPSGGLGIAPFGTIVSHELAQKDYPLPTFFSLSAGEIPLSPAFGEQHMPFTIRNLRDPIPNLRSNVPPVVEALVGETLRIVPTGSLGILRVEVIDALDAAQLALTVSETGRIARDVVIVTGRYQLRIVLSDGGQVDVRLVVCEPECLDRIPDNQRSGGASVRKRLVLRSLAANDLTFTGTARELVGRSLTPFGA